MVDSRAAFNTPSTDPQGYDWYHVYEGCGPTKPSWVGPQGGGIQTPPSYQGVGWDWGQAILTWQGSPNYLGLNPVANLPHNNNDLHSNWLNNSVIAGNIVPGTTIRFYTCNPNSQLCFPTCIRYVRPEYINPSTYPGTYPSTGYASASNLNQVFDVFQPGQVGPNDTCNRCLEVPINWITGDLSTDSPVSGPPEPMGTTYG